MKLRELLTQIQDSDLDPDTEVVWFDYETGSDRSAKMAVGAQILPYFKTDKTQPTVVRFELEDKKTY